MLVVSALLACPLPSAPVRSIAQDEPAARFVAGFDADELGKPPPGWYVKGAENGDFRVEVSDQDPFAGARCVHLRQTEGGEGEDFGNLIQSFDATPYRGKRIALRAAVRSAGGADGQLWLRVDGPLPASELIDNMQDRPVRDEAWKRYAIVGDVRADAGTIVVGLMRFGAGELWLDEVEVSIVGPAGSGDEPPRPLETRALENVTAFARLYGYVRHFHPSDQAARADWTRIAIDGVRAVEPATDAAALATALQRVFAPVAPTLRVFASAGAAPDPVAELGWPSALSRPRVVRWMHRGYGDPAYPAPGPGPYSSFRDSERLVDGEVPEGWRRPGATFDGDLGGGVACHVPIVLFRDVRGTLPHDDAAREAALATESVNFRAADRATRLAAVIQGWNVLQHFYPYFDVVGADWPAELARALRSAATDSGDRAFLDTLRRMVSALHDGHGTVNHASDTDWAMPPCDWEWAGDELVVTAVAAADASGLRVGDVVRSIDGVSTAKAYERFTTFVSTSTPQHARHCALEHLARGQPDSTLRLAIARGDGTQHDVALVRTRQPQPFEAKPAKITALEPGVWYVDLDRVTDEDFVNALPNLETAKGLVFDLRGYPSGVTPAVLGHLIGEAVQCARWNVPRLVEPDRRAVEWVESRWDIEPAAPRLHAKIAFVTDGRAVSYAETYMGIVEHYQLAAIVGQATAGTNGNAIRLTLPGGYAVSFTGMKVLKHDGSRHHGVGIRPTIPVARTPAGIAAGRDELLERAVEAVRP